MATRSHFHPKPRPPGIGQPPDAMRPRRPLAYIAAAYIAGIASCYLFAPPRELLIAGLAISIAMAVYKYFHVQSAAKSRSAWAPFALLLCAVLLAGSIYAHSAFTRTDPLESGMENGMGYVDAVIGRVLFAEQRAENYRLLTIWADGRKLLVREYGEKGKPMSPLPEDIVGKCVSLRGALSYPETARNPRCFDHRLHLLSKNIRLILTCELKGDVTVLPEPDGAFTGHGLTPENALWHTLGALAHAKAKFTEHAQAALPPEDAALFRGMMFGDKDMMDEETYDLFKRNGVAHILSVSGLHVGMVYAFVSAALGRRKTKRFYIAVLAVLLCYAALSGFSPSVMRAFAMITVHIGSKLLDRRYDMLTGVLLSALIMLIANPLALFGVGFILSYTAVLSLSFALPFADRHTGFKNKLTRRTVKERELLVLYKTGRFALVGARCLKTLIPVAIIQAFMLPLTAFFFNCLPLAAVLANIPVIMLAALIVPFGVVILILTAIGIALPFLHAALASVGDVGLSSSGVLIEAMLFFTKAADSIPGSSLTVPSPPLPLLLLFYGAAFFLLSDIFAVSVSRLPPPSLLLPIVIAIACMLAATSPVSKTGDAPFTFVDVGQGDCLHIRTADGRNYLMDGGGRYDYDVGKNILAPYLLKNGVRRLDGVFLSHLHMDHLKGIAELAAQMDIDHVYAYEGNSVQIEAITRAFTEPGADPAFPAESLRYLAAGDAVLLGGFARAEALYPPGRTEEEYLYEAMGSGEDENLTSLIIRFEIGDIRILMTGDVSGDGELAALATSDLSCDILKIGHHGSKASTSASLLAGVCPAAAVIQAGKNSYGHPSSETLKRLEAAGVPVYRNDESGAILIYPLPGGFSVQTVKRDFVSPMLLKAHERARIGPAPVVRVSA